METFKLVVIRNVNNHFYVHCLSLPENVKEEIDVDIQACLNDYHVSLVNNDTLLVNATIVETDTSIIITGEKRGWLRFKNTSSCCLPDHISDHTWWLPWEKRLTLFGKERKVLRGVAITKGTRSEGFYVSHPRTMYTLVKHVIS